MSVSVGYTDESEFKTAWYTIIAVALIVFVGSSFAVLADLKTQNASLILPLRALSIFISGCALFLLFKKGKNSSRVFMTTLFLFIILPQFPITWIAQSSLALMGKPWTPFVGYKIAFFALAICVVGSVWLNAILIIGFAIEAVALWFWYDLANQPWIIGTGEPQQTIGFAIIGGILLFFRKKYQETTRSLALSQARASMLEQMAKLFLTVRDKSNSPLQAIEFEIEILREMNAENRDSADGIQRSLNKLKELNKIFSELESKVVWNGTELFDAQGFLMALKNEDRNDK